MDGILDTAGQFVLNNYGLRHFIIGLAVLIQGEITVLLSMYLILNHYLGWGGFLISVAIATAIYEGFFYLLGKYFNNSKIGLWIEKKVPRYARFQFFFHQNSSHFLTFSKFVVYLNLAVLLLSGWSKMHWKRFLKHRLLANFIWFSVNIGVSYGVASGINLILSEEALHNLEIGIIILILFVIFGSKSLIKKAIEKKSEIEERAEIIGKKIK